MTNFIKIFLILLLCSSTIIASMTGALIDLEPLLETHKKVLVNFESYMEKERKRLNIIEKQLERYVKGQDMATGDLNNFLLNPINSYTLLKRLTVDLDFTEQKIKEITVYKRNMEAIYPSQEDLIAAAVAISRLQETYRLNATELANGILNASFSQDRKPYTEIVMAMTPSDCHELGRIMCTVFRDYTVGLTWLMEAANKRKSEYSSDDLSFGEFPEYSLDELQNYLEESKKIPASHKKIMSKYRNMRYVMPVISKELTSFQRRSRRNDTEKQMYGSHLTTNDANYDDVMEKTEMLCRGETNVSKEYNKRLNCKYLTENHLFLKLAPMKLEQLHIKPDILMLHEVLNDNEIEHLIKIAKPELECPLDYNKRTGKLESARNRIRKVAVLLDGDTDVTTRISRRLSDVTGLYLDDTQKIQISNYGLGGHFSPHYDYNENSSLIGPYGNSIATILIYLSDVEQGGATVFPDLGLSVHPVRGAALFWPNLHSSGEVDHATRHAGCPVLRGNKWVLSKFIHERGQEFRWPCLPETRPQDVLRKTPLHSSG